MKPRAVRVHLPDANAMFRGEVATLVDLSRSGALLTVKEPVAVDSQGIVALSVGGELVELIGKVVRTRPADVVSARQRGHWLIGVEFLSPSHQQIGVMLRRLMGAHR